MSLIQLGRLQLQVDEPREAVALFERAITILEAQPGHQNGELEAHMFLGMAILAAHGDRARAVAEVRLAREGLRKAGPGQAEALASADEWLREHGVAP